MSRAIKDTIADLMALEDELVLKIYSLEEKLAPTIEQPGGVKDYAHDEEARERMKEKRDKIEEAAGLIQRAIRILNSI